MVDAEGPADPGKRLRLHALLNGRFIVEGYQTGQVRDDGHCGAYPAFVVASLRARAPVQRVFSQGSLDGQLHVYTQAMPADRYAPEDFEDGPAPRLLDAESCQEQASCTRGSVRQTDATGRTLCCRFL